MLRNWPGLPDEVIISDGYRATGPRASNDSRGK